MMNNLNINIINKQQGPDNVVLGPPPLPPQVLDLEKDARNEMLMRVEQEMQAFRAEFEEMYNGFRFNVFNILQSYGIVGHHNHHQEDLMIHSDVGLVFSNHGSSASRARKRSLSFEPLENQKCKNKGKKKKKKTKSDRSDDDQWLGQDSSKKGKDEPTELLHHQLELDSSSMLIESNNNNSQVRSDDADWPTLSFVVVSASHLRQTISCRQEEIPTCLWMQRGMF